jgi:hypothetical protein
LIELATAGDEEKAFFNSAIEDLRSQIKIPMIPTKVTVRVLSRSAKVGQLTPVRLARLSRLTR